MESIPLSPFDLQGSFSNIPYAFFYENTQCENDFMPFDFLKGSLWASLQRFPILTGRLRARSTGHIVVEVDAGNPNQPDIRETLCDSVHWSQLKESSFAWDAWPAGVATVGPVATAAADGEIKLLNIHVMRLAQNSGVILFINIPHYVVDGVGYFAFINHWAETMRMQQQQQEQENEARSRFSFDRGIIQRYLPTERAPLDPLTASIYGQRNLLVDWLAWLSPTTLGGLLSKTAAMARGEAHLFRIPRASLDQVHKDVQPYIPASARLSDNDLLVALISKTYIQSQPQPKPPTGFLSWLRPGQGQPESHCTVRIPCDVRRHLKVRERYTGNLLLGMMVRTPLAELARPTSSETLAAAALNVRQSIERVQPGLVAACGSQCTRRILAVGSRALCV
ncbi:hypothetical protein CNMCM8714_000578 [Aspergillus fumigatus]|nr:hypothetical protein CNMCM8714_000578 [Aspergillus fumigatus]